MPLAKEYGMIQSVGGMTHERNEQTERIFKQIDTEVYRLSKAEGLFPAQVRLLQPLHICVYFDPSNVFVILDPFDRGAHRIEASFGNRNPVDMGGVMVFAKEKLGFRNPFGFRFLLSVLDQDADKQKEVAADFARQFVEEDLKEIERQERIVRLRPIFRGRDFMLDEDLVFVLSPFGDPFDTLYSDHIKPAVEGVFDLRCMRADDIYSTQGVMEDIWEHTCRARLLIADLTKRNPNVLYETGIAHTVGKEVILITQSMKDVPFDLRHLRHIVYNLELRGPKTLEEKLKKTVSEVLGIHPKDESGA